MRAALRDSASPDARSCARRRWPARAGAADMSSSRSMYASTDGMPSVSSNRLPKIEHGAASEIGDGEPVADEVLVAGERALNNLCRSPEPLLASLGPFGIRLARSGERHNLSLELGHREERPLVDECALVAAEMARSDSASGWRSARWNRMAADSKTKLALFLDDRHAAKRMARAVLVGLTLLRAPRASGRKAPRSPRATRAPWLSATPGRW